MWLTAAFVFISLPERENYGGGGGYGAPPPGEYGGGYGAPPPGEYGGGGYGGGETEVINEDGGLFGHDKQTIVTESK